MKINSKRAKVILERHNELLNLAEQFIRDKDRYAGELRITSDGTIECWENHACHCHLSIGGNKKPLGKSLWSGWTNKVVDIFRDSCIFMGNI